MKLRRALRHLLERFVPVKEYGGVARCDAPPDTMGIPLDRTSAPIDYEGGRYVPERIQAQVGDIVRIEQPGARHHGERVEVLKSLGFSAAADSEVFRVQLLSSGGVTHAYAASFRHPRLPGDYKGTTPPAFDHLG